MPRRPKTQPQFWKLNSERGPAGSADAGYEVFGRQRLAQIADLRRGACWRLHTCHGQHCSAQIPTCLACAMARHPQSPRADQLLLQWKAAVQGRKWPCEAVKLSPSKLEQACSGRRSIQTKLWRMEPLCKRRLSLAQASFGPESISQCPPLLSFSLQERKKLKICCSWMWRRFHWVAWLGCLCPAVPALLACNSMFHKARQGSKSLDFSVMHVSRGIEMAGGMMQKLIERNSTIPTNKSQAHRVSTALQHRDSI